MGGSIILGDTLYNIKLIELKFALSTIAIYVMSMEELNNQEWGWPVSGEISEGPTFI